MPLSTPQLLEALHSVISVPTIPFKGDQIASQIQTAISGLNAYH